MTICNMTIILKLSKYDNWQYDNYFENIVIFEFQNMTKKITYGAPPPHYAPSRSLYLGPLPPFWREGVGGVGGPR